MKPIIKTNHALCGLISGLLLLAAGTVHASLIFIDNFDGYTGTQNASQFNTGLEVSFAGNLPGWSKAGTSAVHAVDFVLGAGVNYAPMFYANNKITLATPMAANDTGINYEVAFDVGPAVYNVSSEKTTAIDGLVFKILRGDNSVLSQSTYMPGAWAGSQTLVPASFQYTGDGTGNIRISVETLLPGAPRFGGAVDNLTLSSVPEPTTALLLLGSGAMFLLRRRRASAL